MEFSDDSGRTRRKNLYYKIFEIDNQDLDASELRDPKTGKAFKEK